MRDETIRGRNRWAEHNEKSFRYLVVAARLGRFSASRLSRELGRSRTTANYWIREWKALGIIESENVNGTPVHKVSSSEGACASIGAIIVESRKTGRYQPVDTRTLPLWMSGALLGGDGAIDPWKAACFILDG